MIPTLCHRCRDIIVQEEETVNIDECDPLVAQMDALLARLTVKRHELKREINQFHSPIIHKLPSGIMSIIFEFCLPDFADLDPPSSGLGVCIPLSLGAVCKHWREIAWSTPTLWSSIVIRVERNNPDLQTAIVREWLARSGQLPLSIRIFSTTQNELTVSALAKIINQYSHRWSDFDLCIPHDVYQYFHATDNHAPILKSIRFHSYGFNKYHFQLTCPRLQRASLSLYRSKNLLIQWDNLTHLYVEDMLVSEYFFILRKTPRLVFSSFSGGDYLTRLERPAEVQPIVSPLRSLRVGIMNDVANNILDNLLCPLLEELSFGPSHLAASLGPAISLIERSASSLCSFAITYISVPIYSMHEDLMYFLQSMPSLKKLSMTFSSKCGFINILGLVVKILSSQRATGTENCLPNLEILEYSGTLYLCARNYSDLQSLPPANNAVQGPLKSIKFDLYPATRIPPTAIPFFLALLMERGLTVYVCSQSQDILQPSINHYEKREKQDWMDGLDLSLMQD